MAVPSARERPLVMGVLNVTPDSFSDGGRWLDPDAAVTHGLELFEEGADLVDVGGESTRPGAQPVDEAEELRRVVPVIEALAGEGRGRVSIDTRKRAVAEAAVAAGATFVNDESASLWAVAAEAGPGVGYAAMHMQGTPETMQVDPHYDDVVTEVCDFLMTRGCAARDAGVDEVWIDPGIGFGKTVDHNLSLLRSVGVLAGTGFPVLIGASRKGFLGRLTGGAPEHDRLAASLAAAVVAMHGGAGMVRAHDVAATVQAARLVGERVGS